MNNFTFHNPTRLVFGRGQIARLAELIPPDVRLMITFGGGSVKKNGVYEQVTKALEGREYTEFWGIEPNPTVETLRKAVKAGIENKTNFLLAVGGGSVLDGTKLVAAGIANPEIEPWDIVLKGGSDTSIPVASVMTLPATGSEMNANAVISRAETKEKYGIVVDCPVFSILDPETTFSLPDSQVANGLADSFVHIMEQYMTTPGQSRPMDRWAEGLLLTLVDIAPKLTRSHKDYNLMADFMLTATLALNNMIGMGISQDWVTHAIGHELTALHGIAHGASLAIVYPGTLRVLKDQKRDKILQYGANVWEITEGTKKERVDRTIEATENYFRSLGLKTRLSEVGVGEETIDIIAERFNKAGVKLGENGNVTGDVARQILKSCL